jgi:hypothetical protein
MSTLSQPIAGEADVSFQACNPVHCRSWGIFKETYKGEGIYWRGSYNVEGQGSHATIAEARAKIDKWLQDTAEKEAKEKEAQIAAGAVRAVRTGDSVTVYFPDGPWTGSMTRYRQNVFDFEAKYGEIVFTTAPG